MANRFRKQGVRGLQILMRGIAREYEDKQGVTGLQITAEAKLLFEERPV